jgi:hypothetical protein
VRRTAVTVAMTVLCPGCSLNSAGTADDIALVDANVAPSDTAVDRDTGIFAVEDAAIDDSSPPDAVTDAGCPAAKAGAKPCEEIPAREALATGQVLDGKPDDFCDVPYVDFDNGKGAIRTPTTRAVPRRRCAFASRGRRSVFTRTSG